MSTNPQRPDWRRMGPGPFGRQTKTAQDALFLTDETDPCGTETLDGFGFGATLWGTPESSSTPETHPDSGQ